MASIGHRGTSLSSTTTLMMALMMMMTMMVLGCNAWTVIYGNESFITDNDNVDIIVGTNHNRQMIKTSLTSESLAKSRRRRRRHPTNTEPLFDKSLYIVGVPEEKEKGYIVTTMSATDRESNSGSDLLYQMSAILDARSQSMFAIDSTSGVVATTVRLDREFMDVHFFRILAIDSGLPARTATSTLQINVDDENDHSPVFELASYEALLRESSPISTTVLTVRAIDADSGANSDLEYSIINPSGPNEAFKIDGNSGIITTRATLDREVVDLYTLTVQASDSGPVHLRRNSQTTVTIKILDDNDNYPQFSEKSYSVQIAEDLNYSKHPVIAKVSAYDEDEGLNSVLRYSIIGGNTQGLFQMDSLNGEISVVGPLDYEASHSYRLVVRAQDAGSPPRSNTTQLLVNILDKNDNEPKFYTSLFQETIVENSPVGSSIVRVQAYDADDGDNAMISYSIRNANSPDMPISVDNQTGWLFTNRELDWEESSLYEFVVQAQDNGSPPLSASANVIIRVQDLNDNAPLFAPKIYQTSVSETETVGSPVISVTAADKDENPRLIFQISSGNSRSRFSIITQNGQGLISIAQPLDYKADKKFVLTVTATDSGGKFDTATVYINVTDANTHRPIIEKTPYAITIPEDTPLGTTVLVIEATDADVGQNARITFQMDDLSEFRIDANSGAIVTTKQLDREQTAGYTIAVTAIDNGVPPLADTTNVEIEIGDVNDNSPQFKQTVYTASISEDAPIGSSVVQLGASDQDLGLNGQVRYTFAGGNDGGSSFVIDQTSGVVRTNKMLDRETTPVYQLTALAVDRGVPSMSSSVQINVQIDDCNDNPPRFPSEKIKLYVPENSPIGWTVGVLTAVDPDEGSNSKVDYSIVGGVDMKSFSLKPRPLDNSAELISGVDMDYESTKKVYHIIVRASSLPLRNDVDVEIHVTDVNDHAPILRDFTIIFNNYKNHFPLNQVIARIPAYDDDVADRLNYRFVSGNNANLLIVNETNGNIKLSPSLNTNVPMRAIFSVSVTDGINEAAATCHLLVNLVTEAMLFNSVTIRLNKMTQKMFLSSMFDRFIEGLAAIVPCPKENIIVFNIQDDIEIESEILNVSFSARLIDSRDSESFYSPQYLQERVYLSRPLLTKLIGLEVFPFDDNLCVREPCLNFEECLSVLKFGSASDFIGTDTVLFRSINPINTFACRCPKGFQGMHHKYECDTEINLCFSSPCLNGGVCVHQEGGYVCLCNDGYVGKNCEINLILDHCRNGLCKSDSQCVNSRSMKIKATLNTSSSTGTGSFQCVNCSLEQWSTPLCELKTRSFTRGSYLTFSSLRQRYRLNIRLKFATKLSNALLLYNGRYNEKHDFIALELIDSKVVFSFSVGANISQVSVQTKDGLVNDGQWHQIEVIYVNRTATLKLDNCDQELLHAINRYHYNDPNHYIDPQQTYWCANTTSLQLEPRCADKMQTCYRFLDLTGPLQIGGLPVLPTHFQTTNSQFDGCISDLIIDNQLIDLNSYVANNSTTAGCPDKHNFCQSQPCLNGGTCLNGWSNYQCECSDSFSGQQCGQPEQLVKQFKGDGLLSFTPRLQAISLPWIIGLQFKTIAANGVLLRLQLGHNSIVVVEIVNSNIRYTYDMQTIKISDYSVNDGKWHQLDINWMTNGVQLDVDFGQYKQFRNFDTDISGLYVAKATVGGIEVNDIATTGDNNYPNYFIGCIKSLDLAGNRDGWLRPSLQTNVEDGCIESNPCLSNPCPPNSRCYSKAFSKYECKCNDGFAGDQCLDICHLNPCSVGSKCQRWTNTSRGYKCQCDDYHTGLNCLDELPKTCPSNWWGYPICGPCNCDTSKGYDGNCNKTSGECSCEQNHFQPLNSDICFKCDCYSTGSYTSRCDTLSGQCRCRPGVIGRRCDSCSSPFAEVTLRGCEVIYDGCPRAFTEQIWWERTQFGQKASQVCPPNSQGKAQRYCSDINGWTPPDLFDCTSNTFVELAQHSQLLENQELTLTAQLSIKIASDLRNAINSTETLYGSDIQIAYRLIRHIIGNELKQRGLNLTHKQDRYFIGNIIESTSSILEPRYEMIWDTVADRDRGPEHLIKLFNNYLETLIDNQMDTFTDPFEISSKWMTIGLDTVSSDQLWDMPRSLNSYVNTSQLIESSAPSVYVDTSLPPESNPAVAIPKYNNFPNRKQYIDDITKAFIPLKLIAVKSLQEIAANPLTASFDKQKDKSNNAVIGYAIFSSLAQLLPSVVDSSVRHRFGQPFKGNSPVIVMTMRPTNGTKLVNKSFQSTKVQFRLRTLVRSARSNPQCVYWAFNSNGNSRTKSSGSGQLGGQTGRGRWSSKGCEVKGTYTAHKYRLSYDYINCSCDRSIGVALLMDINSNDLYISESLVQVVVSSIGSLISLGLLSVTLFVLTAIRGIETNSNSIHKNLVLCLLLSQLIFLTASRLRSSLVEKEFGCKIIAISLQYFFMSLFAWSCVQSIHLHRMLTEIRDINHGPMRFYYFIGYAIPAIIVGLTVGVRADQYGNYLFCWLSIYESIIWSLVAPICVAIIINLVVFLLAIQASVQIKEAISDYGNLRTLLWLSIILLPLLGSVWILALLSVNDSLDELHYGYSMMSLLTSLYVFIGYCVINYRVRHNVQALWARIQGKKAIFIDDSLSGTRTSLAGSRSAPVFHNSSFDVLHRNINICASSTTSRSTVTKTSSSVLRHKRRRAINEDRSESDSDDVSYDRSLDLASSHSSDDDDNSTAPKQNRINAAIQQQSHSHHLHRNNIVDNDDNDDDDNELNAVLVSNASILPSLQSFDYSTSTSYHPKWPPMMMASHSVPSNSPPLVSPTATDGGTATTTTPSYLRSRPYSRSNILAMTAGLTGNNNNNNTNSLINETNNNNNIVRDPTLLSQPPLLRPSYLTTTTMTTPSSHINDLIQSSAAPNHQQQHHHQSNDNLSDNINLSHNKHYEDSSNSKANSISEILTAAADSSSNRGGSSRGGRVEVVDHQLDNTKGGDEVTIVTPSPPPLVVSDLQQQQYQQTLSPLLLLSQQSSITVVETTENSEETAVTTTSSTSSSDKSSTTTTLPEVDSTAHLH
ncbi:protocadherin-like wing polarity protein stan [Oppia nitens]|uniref:protocadherin-like wing polarity protein stan n=1 Tax=Oppia nitens TaxID=1686743 RepID=UPI0023DAA3DC|nr:protocadherin-like wing polarity protein stan [Oppia nitens]